MDAIGGVGGMNPASTGNSSPRSYGKKGCLVEIETNSRPPTDLATPEGLRKPIAMKTTAGSRSVKRAALQRRRKSLVPKSPRSLFSDYNTMAVQRPVPTLSPGFRPIAPAPARPSPIDLAPLPSGYSSPPSTGLRKRSASVMDISPKCEDLSPLTPHLDSNKHDRFRAPFDIADIKMGLEEGENSVVRSQFKRFRRSNSVLEMGTKVKSRTKHHKVGLPCLDEGSSEEELELFRRNAPTANKRDGTRRLERLQMKRSQSSMSGKIVRSAVKQAQQQCKLRFGDMAKHKPRLPTVKSSHEGLQVISTETVADLVRGKYSRLYDAVHIADCRFPFEYNGGHIRGARSLPTPKLIEDTFLADAKESKRVVIVFHCEFSANRGPKGCKYLRRRDREIHGIAHFPKLFYPELYLMQGGYKEFQAKFPELCDPQGAYTPMSSKEHLDDCRRWIKDTRKLWRTSKR